MKEAASISGINKEENINRSISRGISVAAS